MSEGIRVAWCGAVIALGLAGCDPSAKGAESLWNETFVQVQGGTYRLPPRGQSAGILLFFISHDCPISNRYAPEIRRLAAEFGSRNIRAVVVYAEAGLSPGDARRHWTDFGAGCPAILDPRLLLARRVGATMTPEAAILSPRGDVLYRGRIDDQYPEWGVSRPQPTRRDLRDALEAVLSGTPVVHPRTPSVGCPIYFPPEGTRAAPPGDSGAVPEASGTQGPPR